MQGNLERSLVWCISNEGGFAIREDEPGGAVSKGVSMLVFQEWRAKQGKPPPTIEDLRNITDAETREIYTARYALPVRFDELPLGLDFVMLDIAIMEGARGSRRILQLALNILPPTGHYDLATWEAATTYDARATVLLLRTVHYTKKFYSKGWKRYPGWGGRILRRTVKALEMIDEQHHPSDPKTT